VTDELEQLRAENRRLRDVLDWTNAQCRGGCGAVAHFALDSKHSTTMTDVIREVRAEVEPLKAEIERLRSACIELNSAVSRIDYAFGEPNEMEVSEYDIHADPEAVIRRANERVAQRRSDNDDLARSYDMGRDGERAAVVAYLNKTSGELERKGDPEWGVVADLALHLKAGFHRIPKEI